MSPFRDGSDAEVVRLTVNGRSATLLVEPRVSLADALRDQLALTGTHIGCAQGFCGACTVLVDGRSARACLMLAVQADGREVTTVEGLDGADGEPTAVQAAFVREHALQCGFCTPGFVVLASELVAEARAGARFTREQLTQRLAANACRCTGYAPIVAAVEAAISEATDGVRVEGSGDGG